MAMPRKIQPIEGAVTPAEALRFSAVADEVIRSPKYRMAGRSSRRATDRAAEGDPHIGVLREKRLHAAIKLYLCPDEACHERPVADLLFEEREVSAKKRRMVADILMDGHILEVQTGGFFPLKENKDIRLHAAWSYNEAYFGGHYLNLGIKWNLNITKAAKQLLSKL